MDRLIVTIGRIDAENDGAHSDSSQAGRAAAVSVRSALIFAIKGDRQMADPRSPKILRHKSYANVASASRGLRETQTRLFFDGHSKSRDRVEEQFGVPAPSARPPWARLNAPAD
jgi:hypothetical protein